jgi:hypothetical protein
VAQSFLLLSGLLCILLYVSSLAIMRLLHPIQKAVDSLLAELRGMRIGIENQVDAIDRHEKAQQQRAESEQRARAELHLPQSNVDKKKGRSKYKKWLHPQTIVQALTLIAVVYYACYAKRQWDTMHETLGQIQQQTTEITKANEINRTASAVAQRAYVFYPPQSVVLDHGLAENGDTVWAIIPVVQNGGNTPAFNVLHHFNSNGPAFRPLPKGFTYPDNHGRSIVKTMSQDIGPTVIGPHTPAGAGEVAIAEPDLKKIVTEENHVFIWGWTTYEDVFGCSHKTEVCLKVVDFLRKPSGEANLHAQECPEHNCVDKDCNDWKPTNTPICLLEKDPLKVEPNPK